MKFLVKVQSATQRINVHALHDPEDDTRRPSEYMLRMHDPKDSHCFVLGLYLLSRLGLRAVDDLIISLLYEFAAKKISSASQT